MKTNTILTSVVTALLLVSVTLPHSAYGAEKLFYYFDNVYGHEYFSKNSRHIDVIAPQVYTVGHDLKVQDPTNKRLIREAKRKKSDVMPLIVNESFSKVLMSDLLLDTAAQDEIIQYMVDEAQKQKYIGWQFDFENLNHLDRDMYTAFVAKTYRKMQENNLLFSVAVVPRSSAYDPTSTNQDWSSGYDFAGLAQNADFISLMSYDDPYSTGPVASLPFTERILGYMMTQIPAHKISLGIPLYCWKWDSRINARVGSLTHNLAQKEFEKGENTSQGYDEVLGAQWFKYTLNETPFTTWCESEKSIETKMNLIETKGLRGFSAWAIGQESTDWFWKLMRSY